MELNALIGGDTYSRTAYAVIQGHSAAARVIFSFFCCPIDFNVRSIENNFLPARHAGGEGHQAAEFPLEEDDNMGREVFECYVGVKASRGVVFSQRV